MRVYHPADIELKLPPGHRFPAAKYALLRRRLLEDGVIEEQRLLASPHADAAVIAGAHCPRYVAAIIDGSIAPAAMRRIGFPWSDQTWRRAAATIGGAVAAARAALEDGVCGQLAGGTHHAHYDFGAGYCVFNDLAVVALTLLGRAEEHPLVPAKAGTQPSPALDPGFRRDERVRRIAIVDLDVHQGDGTAAMLEGRADVFTFSVHGAKNFPFRKAASTLDVALPDGVGDRAYLAALAEHLPAVWAFRPDLVLYQAGVDPLKEDRLGRMALSHQGLFERDRMVLEGAHARGIPVSIAMGGGYADPIAKSVEAYANTWRVARAIY